MLIYVLIFVVVVVLVGFSLGLSTLLRDKHRVLTNNNQTKKNRLSSPRAPCA